MRLRDDPDFREGVGCLLMALAVVLLALAGAILDWSGKGFPGLAR